jgi:arginyl-tRNA synthetase
MPLAMNVLHELQQKLHAALTGLVDDPTRYAALVKPSQDARFGDYQATCAMPLAKVLGQKPPEIAQRIIERLDLGDMLEPPTVAGPGFINLRLRADWLARRMQAMAAGDRLGVEPGKQPRTFVIDFSSPNVAKPMHVGHLRSTIIGDALTRLLRFLGHKVITDNHLGDWGGQFGMLLYGYKHFLDAAALAEDPVQEMVRLYVRVRQLTRPAEPDEDEQDGGQEYTAEEIAGAQEVLAECRQETAKLQAGDAENRALWEQFKPWCYEAIQAVYDRLGVTFDHTLGESFYQSMLAGVVDELLARGIAEQSQGAVVIFNDQRPQEPPALLRYSSGAFSYTTTDLATIKYRMEEWHPGAILYVVGRPQEQHFRHLFRAAQRWVYDKVELSHIDFGSVLGPDRKMLRTREGDTPLLMDLLDQALVQAERVYEEICRRARERGEEVVQLSEEEKGRLYEVVGLGAVKYADLSQNRSSDYVFDLEKMTSTEGNTATYMQYAYVRNRGIFRKGNIDPTTLRQNPVVPSLAKLEERHLALQLARFDDALTAAAAEYRPNLITAYLWELSRAYSGFFQNCPVLKAETPELRQSRLLLCDLTARALRRGLDLLGIQTVERM